MALVKQHASAAVGADCESYIKLHMPLASLRKASNGDRKLTSESQRARGDCWGALAAACCLVKDVSIVSHAFLSSVWDVHIIAKDILRCHCEFCEQVPASVIQLVSCTCACRIRIAVPSKARLEVLAEQK